MTPPSIDPIGAAEFCRTQFREGLRFPPWSEERAQFWAASLEKFIEWFIRPPLSIPDFHREWIHLLCRQQFLCLLAPRNHGKTHVTGCYYPLWRICMQPNSTLLSVARSVDVASLGLRTIKGHIEANELLRLGFGRLKPENPERWTASEIIVERSDRTLKDATLTAIGQGSSILTRRVSDGLILCDDIVGDETVQTPEGRERVFNWFMMDLLPVLEPDEQLVLIGTRRHHDDLYGRLQKSGTFHVETYDAFKEEHPDGTFTTLWPEKWPWEKLEARRQIMGSLPFNREYRNVVLSDADSLFPMRWFTGEGGTRGCFAQDRSILHQHHDDYLRKVMAVDVAIGQGDRASYFVVMTLGLDQRGDFHLLNLFRERLSFPDQVRAIARLYDQFLPSTVIVENNGYQQALVEALAAEHPNIPVIPHTTHREKNDPTQGILMLQPLIEAGRIRFPMGDPQSKEASIVVISELNEFGSAKYDDCVIALWMGAARLQTMTLTRSGRAYVIRSELTSREEDYGPRRWPHDPGGQVVGTWGW